ncbi:hypothetical protein Tco_0881259 [Tanacetum coccineum]
MTTLPFADTHNLVVFLDKPAETTVKVKTVNGAVQLQALVDGKKIIITESTIRRDLQLKDAEATNQKFNFSKYIFDSMVKNVDNVNKFLMYPRFVQMFVNQQAGDMSNHKRIYVTPSHTKKVFGNMKREGKGFSGRVTPLFPSMMIQAQQEQGEGSANPTDPQHTPTIAQPSSSQPQKKHKPMKPKKKDTQIPQSSIPSDNIAKEAINKENVPTHSNDLLLSGEDRLKLKELMALCTNLQNMVLNLEHTKTTQALEIDNLKTRVKKLENKQMSRTYELRRLYKVRHDDDLMFDTSVFNDEEVFAGQDMVEKEVSTADLVTTAGEVVTTANVESARPKTKGVVMQEPSETTTTTTIPSKDKEAIKLQAQFDEEERIAREKEEDNDALIAQWNDIQDKVETDYELAQRLQAEEQDELTIEEKSKLFQQLLEKRRKHFAAKRAEERRNRPPTKAQQSCIMCTYLKNMAGWKPKDLKTKSFANVQELFDKAMKRVNTFVDTDTELVGGSEVREEGSETIAQKSSLKRVSDELEQDKSKNQKLDEKVEAEVDDAKESEELKQCLKVVPDDGDGVTIDATPLSVKIPIMLKNFDSEDLEVLWRIVKARFKKTKPVNYMDIFLHLNLKTMFEHHVEDSIWKNQQGLVKVLNWKPFYSCRVHCVTVQTKPYYLLVEKMYPFTKHTLHQMFNDVKFQVDYECEMAFELFRLVKKQLKEGYLVLLVQKLLLLALKVNAAGIKVTTAERIKTAQRKDKDCL